MFYLKGRVFINAEIEKLNNLALLQDLTV